MAGISQKSSLEDPHFNLLRQHLTRVSEEHSTPLDLKLFEYFPWQRLERETWEGLLRQSITILPQLQQDPTPLTSLIEFLIRPEEVSFTSILSLLVPLDIITALDVGAPPSINLVILKTLAKARMPSEVDSIASMPEVVYNLVKLWLCTPETAVTQRAHETILHLLLVSISQDEAHDSQGDLPDVHLMWRRIFRDKDVYGLIFSTCSLNTPGDPGSLGKRDRTIAQARLLALLPEINLNTIQKTQIAEVEKQYGVKENGLLEFAAMHMVDYEQDFLMHITLIDFFAKFLYVGPRTTGHSPSVSPLDFLQKWDLHARTLSYYLEPHKHPQFEATYLSGPAADYFSAYSTHYPYHLMNNSRSLLNNVLSHLSTTLDSITPGRWAQGQSPSKDLHVLVSLPRVALLPNRDGRSIISKIPVMPANADALKTLATVFGGLQSKTLLNIDNRTKVEDEDRAAARILYYLYLARYPHFWQECISTAETIALKENALAAISLMEAVIMAVWEPKAPTAPSLRGLLDESSSQRFRFPPEEELSRLCGTESPLPVSGLQAIIENAQSVITYLLQPAQTFSNLVGGRGDPENAAYKVAIAKYEVVRKLQQRVEAFIATAGNHTATLAYPNLRGLLAARVTKGPLGGTSNIGGVIATMDL